MTANLSLERHREFKITNGAAEKVFANGAGDWFQGGSRLVGNPTTGTLEITPDLRMKARKALMAEVRRMKVRLYLNYARLYLRKFLLSCKSTRLNVIGYLYRGLGYERLG